MKYPLAIFLGLAAFGLTVSCSDPDMPISFTGNETTYSLQQASDYVVSGTVAFKERTDGTASVIVSISGTEPGTSHPVHLHLGGIEQPDAEIAALLNPVIGSTGKSETHIIFLADESTITYQELNNLDASIKVHLSDTGIEKNIILAAGNVGKAAGTASGRSSIGVCKSE